MKNGLKKLGIVGLTTLISATPVQKTMAVNNEQNKKNILEVLDDKKDSKIDISENYIATAADLDKQNMIDSLDITRSIKQMSIFADKLVKFYGEEGLSKKIQDIRSKYPNLDDLSSLKKKDIIKAEFNDFFKKYPDNDMIAFLAFGVLLALWGITLHNSRKTSTHYIR